MPALATFLPQLALVLVPLVTAVLAYKTARRHQLPPIASATPAPSSGTTLNGSFLIIRTCLERLQTLQALYDEEHTRAIRLEARLEECQKRHTPRQKKVAPVPPATASPSATATAGEVGLAPHVPAATPARSRSGNRRRRAQG